MPMSKPILNEPATPIVNENSIIPQPIPPVTPNTQLLLVTPHTPRSFHNLADYNTPGLL